MAGWGTSAWGTGLWGSAGGGTLLTFVSALATSERTVLVSLSGNALALSPLRAGDALNASTWKVTARDALGAQVRELNVLAVRVVVPTSQFELYTLQKFDGWTVTHRVESATLLSASLALVGNPAYADFPGVVAIPPTVGKQTPRQLDIANRPFAENNLAGSLRVTTAADYALEGGADLVRKLIVRRLTTGPDAFFHLQGYGLGLALKEPLTVSDLTALQAEIERQVQQEPEVDAASCALTLDRQGILTIRIRARLRSSAEELPVTLAVPTTLVL